MWGLVMEKHEKERFEIALGEFKSCLMRDPDIMSNKTVLVGTRFLFSSVLAEISEGSSIKDIAENYDLDFNLLQDIFMALSVIFDTDFPLEMGC